MSARSTFDVPITPYIMQILEDVRDRTILIPEFQREFEWDDQERILLLDSVWRGYPIGSLLVWQTTRVELAARGQLGAHRLMPVAQQGGRRYLLDGLQRLTVLYTALMPPTEATGTNAAGSGPHTHGSTPIYFDLNFDPNTFDPKKAKPSSPFHVLPRTKVPAITDLPMNLVMDPTLLIGFQKTLLEKGMVREVSRAESVANLFKRYQLPIIVLSSDDLTEVTQTFVRINTQGRPVSEFNVLRALSLKKFRLDDELDRVRAELSTLGWGGLDSQTLINILKLRWDLDVYRTDPSVVAKALEQADRPKIFEELVQSLTRACDLLGACGVHGPAVLPYSHQLLVLAEVLRQHPEISPQAAPLQQWFWETSYMEYFAGSTGSRVRQAIQTLQDRLSRPEEPVSSPGRALRIPVLSQFRFTSVRSRIAAIRMADLDPDPISRLEALIRLGQEGVAAVQVLYPDHSAQDPGNRILLAQPRDIKLLKKRVDAAVDAQLAIFGAVRASDRGSDDDTWFGAVLGVPDWRRTRTDPDTLLEKRRERLLENERAFVARFGWTLEEGIDETVGSVE